nr:MAG TPA: hypothetical protein [Caudoviricetes sp.]
MTLMMKSSPDLFAKLNGCTDKWSLQDMQML